jgi:putative two-component system response regulator
MATSMPTEVLVLDQAGPSRQRMVACLESEGFVCTAADTLERAVDALRHNPRISLALMEWRACRETGLRGIRAAASEMDAGRILEFVALTRGERRELGLSALRQGALDFLEQPVEPTLLVHAVTRAIELIQLRCVERAYHLRLEQQVAAKTRQVQRLVGRLETAYQHALDCLAEAAEYKDTDTGSHIRRIGAYAEFLAGHLGWADQQRALLAIAAPLHDVGKIGIPDSILLKAGQLTAQEAAVMRTHSAIGHAILARAANPVMQMAAAIALSHHERWDGTGYPHGIDGEAIPGEARIVAICDVYDALRSFRPYKAALGHAQTVEIILRGDGRVGPGHFDPAVLEVFRREHTGFAEIFERLQERCADHAGGG